MKLDNPIISELANNNQTYFENILYYNNSLYVEVCENLHIILDNDLRLILIDEFKL